jgi:hypothetical protein
VLSAPLGSHEWQQSLSQHVTLFTRQGQQSAELRLHPQDLGQVHISLKLDDNLAQLQMVSPHSHVRAHWKPHYRCCVHSWLKAGSNWGKATSAVKASLAISSLPDSNSSLVALKDKTFLPLKMTQYWQPQPRCKPLPAAMAQ